MNAVALITPTYSHDLERCTPTATRSPATPIPIRRLSASVGKNLRAISIAIAASCKALSATSRSEISPILTATYRSPPSAISASDTIPVVRRYPA